MTSSIPVDEYLAGGESSVTAGTGTVFQETRWTPAAICITDRRILFVPPAGGFVDVGREHVSAIRSRPRTRRSTADVLALSGVIGGGALAWLAAFALLVVADGLAVPTLASVTIAGTLATAAVVATDARLSGADVRETLTRIDRFLARRASIPPPSRDRRREELLVTVVDERPVLRWGAALLGTAGAAGLVALGAWSALGLTAAVAAGAWIAWSGRNRHRELVHSGDAVRRERSVALQLLDGRTVRFRIDADASIDRELRRLTARADGASLPRSGHIAAEERRTERSASTGT